VNESEAELLARNLSLGAADARAAGAAIAKAAGTTVIVTLGGDGAIAFAGADTWTIGTLPITPVDTTAAGDAFVGAFAAAVDARADLPAALHRASVAGGLACTIAGAQPSLPAKAAIEERLSDLAPARRA